MAWLLSILGLSIVGAIFTSWYRQRRADAAIRRAAADAEKVKSLERLAEDSARVKKATDRLRSDPAGERGRLRRKYRSPNQ